MWHVNGITKRLVIMLEVDLSKPIYPDVDVIDEGYWVFTLDQIAGDSNG